MVVELPHNYDTRTYQQDFWDAMVEIEVAEGVPQIRLLKDRAFLIWHRRSGKDLTFINLLMLLAYYHRVGTYWYMFPFLKQAKQVVWDGMDDMGRRFVDYFPTEIVYDTNESELQIILRDPKSGGPGSIIQLMGADKFTKSSVGPNPIGVGFSEYAVSSKMENAWHYCMPMLRQNGGWAIFLTTPRGRNHAYNLWSLARKNTNAWYTSLKTVEHTKRDSLFDKVNPRFPHLSPVITEEMLECERADGMTEEVIQQEYFCSFNAPQTGAYFAKQMDLLRSQGRITRVPWEPTLPVETWWDIGHDDNTSIWFIQKLFREIRCVDFYTNRLQDFAHYASKLREGDRNLYLYSRHIGPHDLTVNEWFVNKTRLKTASDLGVRFEVADKVSSKLEAIEMVRRTLPRCLFDEGRCEYGIAALSSYHAEYDEESKVLSNNPEHDWSSNPVDAFMTGTSKDTTSLGVGPHGTGDRSRQVTGGSRDYHLLARR